MKRFRLGATAFLEDLLAEPDEGGVGVAGRFRHPRPPFLFKDVHVPSRCDCPRVMVGFRVEPYMREGKRGRSCLITVRIPEKLGGHSTRSWAAIPRHRGHLFHELGQVTDAFMGSSLPNLVKRFRGAHLSAHAFSGQGEAVGVVNQAVEDGVGEGWVADGLVPLVDRQLAGDDG